MALSKAVHTISWGDLEQWQAQVVWKSFTSYIYIVAYCTLTMYNHSQQEDAYTNRQAVTQLLSWWFVCCCLQLICASSCLQLPAF